MKNTNGVNETTWSNFAKGLNTLVNPTKIAANELAVATNILLVDEGSPTRRWGSDYYGNDSSGAIVTLLAPYYKSDGTRQLTKIENGLFKRLNTSTNNWDTVSGASFASTPNTSFTLTNDTLYLSNGTDSLTKYNGLGLSRFTTISTPGGISIARGASLISGVNAISYRISAINNVGETLASTSTTVQVDLPRDEWNFNPTSPDINKSVSISWTPVASATGYNIYGVEPGFETYLDTVEGGSVSSYRDYGLKIPSTLFTPPAGNTTDAPKGKYITSFKSSLLIGGDSSNPSRLYYSAGVDKPDSFLISDGGGFIDINKNSDDGEITGLGVYQNSAVIFKERSIWKMDFNDGAIPSLVNINKGIGCISHRSITNVENDLFFLGRKIGGGAAIYVLGNEPNYLNLLRTNELSARVRPEFSTLIASRFNSAVGFYVDGKFIVAYTEGSDTKNNVASVYDRERLGFTKWSSIYIEHALLYYDSSNTEKIVFADGNDRRISELNSNFSTDKGTPISWEYRTRQEDDKAPFLYKRRKWVNLNFRDVAGTNTVRFHIDNNSIDFTLELQNVISRTALRAWRNRVGRLRKTFYGGSSVTSNVSNKRFPFHRKGDIAVGKTFGVSVLGSAAQSKATLLDLSFQTKARSRNYFPLTEVNQI